MLLSFLLYMAVIVFIFITGYDIGFKDGLDKKIRNKYKDETYKSK